MIKITVITCTYNASATFGRTLKSVQNQTCLAVEHIIVDGKSTDSTLQMAEKYKLESDASGNGHEVKIVSEKDRGLYDAMNKGLALASGDYLVFLNAGDKFHDADTLKHVAECAEMGDSLLPGVLYGDTDLVDDNGEFLRHRRLHPFEGLSWRSFRHGMLVCHQAFYALTGIAKVTPYNIKYRYSADVDWCIRIMRRSEEEGRSLRNVRRVVVDYLAEGMTTANHKASLKERFRVMCEHYGFAQTVILHLWFVLRSVIRK